MQTSPHPSAERFRITPQPLHYRVWQTRGSFPGAAGCRTIELPSYEAAPLQVMRPRNLSPFTFHLSSLTPHFRYREPPSSPFQPTGVIRQLRETPQRFYLVAI